ncbi:hypothetical protein CEQ21_23850 [Niallia circulans]|uniref:Uncharacterized protein n=1 Tax=Niallia circulans TaxID=1397 RepID=A0A553SN78_NIACI|nr:hypothetical protein CEQ21_23850 [Niallia circulans]
MYKHVLFREDNNITRKEVILVHKDNYIFGIGVLAILLTTVYTAVLASQLMATKHKVDHLYFKDKFSNQK